MLRGAPMSRCSHSTCAPRRSTESGTTRGACRPHRTPEGEVVSWADRIAYVCHDFEDAVAAGIVTADMLPAIVAERCGRDRSGQLGTFVRAMVSATTATGRIGMQPDIAEALAEFRRFNYEYVYLRPASQRQADAVVSLLRALVEHYADRPHAIPHQTVTAALGERCRLRRRRRPRSVARCGRIRCGHDRPIRLSARGGPALVGSLEAPAGHRRVRPRFLNLEPPTSARCWLRARTANGCRGTSLGFPIP